MDWMMIVLIGLILVPRFVWDWVRCWFFHPSHWVFYRRGGQWFFLYSCMSCCRIVAYPSKKFSKVTGDDLDNVQAYFRVEDPPK